MVRWPSVVVVAVLGCSVDCEEARDKLERCSPRNQTFVMPIINEECNEDDQCLAECVMDNSCDVIRVDLAGGLRDPNESIPEGIGEFRQCIFACVD